MVVQSRWESRERVWQQSPKDTRLQIAVVKPTNSTISHCGEITRAIMARFTI